MESEKVNVEPKEEPLSQVIPASHKLHQARLDLRVLLIETRLADLAKHVLPDEVLLPPELVDETEVFNDQMPPQHRGLAGNYGAAPRSKIEAFFGDLTPLYQAEQ